MSSWLRLCAEALPEPGTQGSWARRFAEGMVNLGTFNGATVGALSGTGPWLKQLYSALSPAPTFTGANWIQRLGDGGGRELLALVVAEVAGGGDEPSPPEGFAFVVDGDGSYVVDGDGAYVVTEI